MATRRASFLTASWVNVLSSLSKILVEGVLGLAFGSVALLADAAHSIADLLAAAVVLVWGRSSFVGPDDDHPHGHDRFEPLTALFVGGTLVLLGGLLLYDSAQTLLAESEARFSVVLVGGLLFALVNRYACYLYTTRVEEQVDSPGLRALVADARNDVYTTLAAVVGVAGIAAGVPVADPLAGGLVSLLVVREGVEVAQENVGYLVDAAPPMRVQAEIRRRIEEDPAVYGVHDFAAYYAGQQVEVEFHAEIAGGMTLAEAHDIETRLRNRVRSIPEVGDAHVHLDPAGVDDWKDADEPADPPTVRDRPE